MVDKVQLGLGTKQSKKMSFCSLSLQEVDQGVHKRVLCKVGQEEASVILALNKRVNGVTVLLENVS